MLRRALAAGILLAAVACRSPFPPAGAGTGAAEDGGEVQWRHDWAHGAVFYEVFVRSFADSDGDGLGDLAGLTARLDYLNDGDPSGGDDLGVDALWLMPVFASPSYHGYDVTDYETIEPDYGTLEDFERLLTEAHRRGVKVIVDLVVNHSSVEHPWFERACCSPRSPYRDWYVWRADDPGWTQPWGGDNPTWHRRGDEYYYGVFWSGMPDLNWRTPAVREEMKRVATLWLGRGLDGFRLDATRHLVANGPGELQNDQPETHRYLKDFAAHVRRRFPEAILVGENWTDTETIATYYGSTERVRGGDELPMSFDFPLAEAILTAVESGAADPVEATLAEIARLYPPGVIDAPFLTNHDQVRLATRLDGDPARLRLAASVLLTLPGAPFLYYGEEIGLPNGPGRDDRHKRTPMPWTGEEPGRGFTTAPEPWFPFAPAGEEVSVAAQLADPSSLLAHYRELIRLRQGSEALGKGELELLTPADPALLAYLRRTSAETVLVAHNLGARAVVEELPAPASAAWERLREPPGAALEATADGLRVTLPARTTGAWRLGD
ncbi:MAG TPA: alpha-amylase family glycosyl hydrolase [Thermoanaerobaculia bacterium]|nr:alpha-amylase family glycosyl hydrolase [Thermoanaerobaculia bacterium]